MEDSRNKESSELDHTPFLKSLKKEDGFTMPQGSSSEMMKNIMQSVKTSEFDVPAGTFDKLPSYQNQKKNAKVIPLWAKIATVAAAAACIALLVVNNSQKEECVTFACLLEQNTITESDLDYLDFDIDEIEPYVETDESFLNETISEEDLEEYILESDIIIDDLWDE
ncbi:MAG: hypothetical protein HRT74_04820 [Flavobacteriales bacterium]|nr:hypothetical protein [Flavobacteriales bacterium]